jgi:hypothetical protein
MRLRASPMVREYKEKVRANRREVAPYNCLYGLSEEGKKIFGSFQFTTSIRWVGYGYRQAGAKGRRTDLRYALRSNL